MKLGEAGEVDDGAVWGDAGWAQGLSQSQSRCLASPSRLSEVVRRAREAAAIEAWNR